MKFSHFLLMIPLDLACEICYYVRQRGEVVLSGSSVLLYFYMSCNMDLRNYMSNLNIERSMNESE